MKKNDIAFVILTCDKFRVTWEPCIDHFFHSWPNAPYPIYLLNNFIPSEDDRVIDLLVGEDVNWSDTLYKGILKIKENRIFFLYDDAFIHQINFAEIELIFNEASINDLESVALRKRIFDRGKRFNEKLYRINPSAKYRTSLFLNLIRKDILLGLLKTGESTWHFEKAGSKRSANLNFYSVYEKGLVHYHHGIVKGKWIPSVFEYLKNLGYPLEDNTFKSHSAFRIFIMKIYTMVFVVVNSFIHRFKRG